MASLEDLIRMKRSSTRAKDKLHLDYNYMDSAQATRFLGRLQQDLDGDPAGAEIMRQMIR